MRLRLDAKTITALALGRGQRELFCWDSSLVGFGLRLQGQRRTYIAQYRSNGRTRRITIGPVERFTPAQAREGARTILRRVSLGHDPQAERQAKRAAAEHTFAHVAGAYLAAKQGELRPASFRITKLYLTGDYFRPLHARGVAEITHPDIAARLSAITRNHSAHTASAARRAISALFRWTMEEGWTQTNPVIGTRRPQEAAARDRVLSDAELVAIWRESGDDDFGKIVRLLILLGSRRQEIGGMRWSEFDLNAGTWTLPKERSKNHRAHTITLPPVALDIIRSVPRGERDHLFGERAGSGFTGWSNAKTELDRRLDGVAPWKLHDLRRSVATKMADIGIEPHHIEAVLNHYSGHRRGPHGIYNKSAYERQVKAALVRWSEHLLVLVEGRASDNVVALHA